MSYKTNYILYNCYILRALCFNKPSLVGSLECCYHSCHTTSLLYHGNSKRCGHSKLGITTSQCHSTAPFWGHGSYRFLGVMVCKSTRHCSMYLPVPLPLLKVAVQGGSWSGTDERLLQLNAFLALPRGEASEA